MSRKVEQGDATRRELVETAIALFTELGYAGASTTQVVQRAGVTRGALYHHFPDKRQLFEAAFFDIEKDIFERCASAAAGVAGDDPVAGLMAGIDAYLNACLQAHVQRILLLEGPLVLGWERSVRFDDPYCARRLLRASLTAAASAGLVAEDQAESLTHLLFGALNQAGVVISQSPDQKAARAAMGEAVATLLQSLLHMGRAPMSM